MGTAHEFVTDSAIWHRIQHALKGEPARIAVPFIGLGASRWIKPAADSWVLTRCDFQSARAGQVSGKDLLVWHTRGVRIFNLQALHAKVFAFHGAAFIGSSNASVTSRDRLVEAGVWTTDRALARSAWNFVESHCLEEVDEAFIGMLAKAYRPPTQYPMHGDTDTRRAKAQTEKTSERRTQDEAPLHLIRLYPTNWSDAQQAAADHAEKSGQQQIAPKLKAELGSFCWKCASTRFAIGDLVLARWTDNESREERVLPWARVVGIRKVRGRDQHMVATATLRSWEQMALGDFRAATGGLMKNFLGEGGRSRSATAAEREAVMVVWRHRSAHLML